MGKIRDYVDRLSKVDEVSQTQALLQIVNKHKAELIDANLLQLYSGRNATGGILGQYRSAGYAALKSRLNPLPGYGIWDLKLRGDLYAGFYVEGDQFPVTMNSSDSKADKFRDADIFGLDAKSKETFREEIKPDIKDYYRSIFQL